MPIQIPDAYRDSDFARRQTGLLFNLPAPDSAVAQLPEGLSLCMIVKNEERFLAECLRSVADVVDEINIVDTGSTDRTVEIARSFGANVEFREWRNDFSWARNESLKMATKRWILVLDADEEIERESRSMLRSIRTVPAGEDAVYLHIVNLVDDSTGAALMSHLLPRLFPNNPRIRYHHVIHEGLALEGGEMKGAFAPVRIVHKGYQVEILKGREKLARNTPLVQRALAENADNDFALFNFGVSAISAGDTDAGIEALEKMFALGGQLKMFFGLAYTVLALAYGEQRGDVRKALEVLDRGLRDFPTDANILFTKGQFQLVLGEHEAARETLHVLLDKRQISRYAPMVDDEIFEWKTFHVIANSYAAEENYEAALPWIDEALVNKPSPFLQRFKAQLLERWQRFFDAEVAWRRLAEMDPGLGRVQYVNYLLRRRRYSAAVSQVQQYSDLVAPEIAAELYLAAAHAVRHEGIDDPVPFLKLVLRQWPASASALSLLEEIYTERGQTEALETLHHDELEADCERLEDYVRRSHRLLNLHRDAEVLAVADRALAIAGDQARLRFNAAQAALRLCDEERALRELNAVQPSAHDEVFGSAMSMLAALHLRRGEPDAAVAATERWRRWDPDDVDALLKQSEIFRSTGRPDDSRALLETKATEPRVAMELAAELLRSGDIAGAGRVAALALQRN